MDGLEAVTVDTRVVSAARSLRDPVHLLTTLRLPFVSGYVVLAAKDLEDRATMVCVCESRTWVAVSRSRSRRYDTSC